MAVNVGINGFGRIGKMVLRLSLDRTDINIVAINDPFTSIEQMIYLLNYDTVHGKTNYKFGSTKCDDYEILTVIKNNEISKEIIIFREREPSNINWEYAKVKVVCESSGVFLTSEKAKQHISKENGVEKIVLSAPPKDSTPIYVMGVNNSNYNNDTIISNASCTTNCLAPLIKIIDQKFGVESALMTTIHAMTATQAVVDRSGSKDFRNGRSASQNIIPASTGAAKAVGKVLPHLDGKITGMAFRVPVADVSVVDVTIQLSKETSYNEVINILKQESEDDYNNIIRIENNPVVSSDLIGDTTSCIVDVDAGIELNSKFMKFVAWYDNEAGYSYRLLDLMSYICK